jgi:hypothetical protein
VHGLTFVSIAAFFAMILRLAIAIRMPTDCFTVLLTVALSVSSFYTYLDVNIPASFGAVPRSSVLVLVVTYLIRLAICIPLAARAVNHQQFLWVLLFIIPPALTAPVTSVLWGGGKYLAVVGSVLLYLALPPVLGVLPYAPGYIYDNKSMTLFYVVLGAGLIFPAACAQAWRKRSPVESAKHRKEWSFLSVWALTALAFIAVYQVTPARRNASIIGNMFYPFQHPEESLDCARNFWQGLVVYVAMKALAALGRKVLVYGFNFPEDHCMDMYIIHTSPNIFLWLGLANSITATDVDYTKFWGVLMFFLWPAVEQSFIIKSFMHKLVRQTTQSKHISVEKLEAVWQVLESLGATCEDPDGEQGLDSDGVAAFLSYVQQLTTGVKEDVPEYMCAALFELLDTDRSGYVAKSELYTYVSSVGLVIDLNGKTRSKNTSNPSAPTHRFSDGAKMDKAQALITEIVSETKQLSSVRLSALVHAPAHAADSPASKPKHISSLISTSVRLNKHTAAAAADVPRVSTLTTLASSVGEGDAAV